MTGVKLEMEEVKANMNKMSEALSKVVDESQKIDQKFEEPFIRINEDIRTRDKEQKQESREYKNILMQRSKKSSQIWKQG